jgi:serine protease AprX
MSNKLPQLKIVVCATLVAASALGLRGATGEHQALLSLDLVAHEGRHTSARARVIVHGAAAEIDALALKHHLQVVRRLADGAVVAANSSELAKLASESALDHLSGDLPVRTFMSVSSKTMGADQAWVGQTGLLGIGSTTAVNGQGIVVAVVDSGISTAHPALANKVVASVSFVSGDPSTDDAFGHGTHVAGIIAGVGSAASKVTPLYTGGIAPGAKLVNVRVLGADGSGYTSDVIAGLDWVIANRAKYNIRVVNLSLGHPVAESSLTDPLCEAVLRAVNSGLVVVAAAGNMGRSADGHMVLGSIMSPGNSPYAITVGATNTFGTVSRSDDAVATYSSRGPTRFDMTVKPDVAAPGNRIVSLEANGSYLPRNYPATHVAGSGPNSYMYLSGTSMATPMVSGAAALLLQGGPGLTPAQIKLLLQSGATYMKNGGLLGSGAGNVNVWASRKSAANGLSATLSTVIGGLGVSASGASFWDAGTLQDRLYAGKGIRLLSLLELPFVLLDPSRLLYGDLNLFGLLNPLQSIAPKWLLYGEVAGWTQSQTIMWGTQIYDPQGQTIMWGTSDMGDTIMWGTMTEGDPQ